MAENIENGSEIIDSVGYKAGKNRWCQPCSEDGKEISAEGLCTDCEEYLCLTCFNAHCIPRCYRGHTILKNEQIKTTGSDVDHVQSRSSTHSEYCSLHKHKLLTHFCEGHQELCCESCINVLHKSCFDAQRVSLLEGDDLEMSEEWGLFNKQLEKVQASYKSIRSETVASVERKDEVHQTALKAFVAAIDKIEQSDKDRLINTKAVCDATLDQISSWRLDIEKKSQNKNVRGLRLLMKRTESSLKIMKENSQQLLENSLNTGYEFVSNNAMPFEVATQIGFLTMSPYLCKQITVRNKGELQAVICTSLHFVPGEKLVANDLRNNSLKILDLSSCDSTSDRLLKSVQTNGYPFQTTLSPNGNIFVTFPTRGILAKFSDRELKLLEEIDVGKDCKAIEYVNGKVKTYHGVPGKVLDMDCTTNKIIRSTDISYVSKGKTRILNTWYSAVNSEDESTIFTCHDNNCVYKVNVDGKVTIIAESDILNAPRGLCMVDKRTLVVCSTEGKALYRVRLDGSISKLVDNLSFKPKAIAFCRETSELAVGGHSDFIHVYSFKF
ncbi:uncharacterized protein LOC128210546 [Mya arenaria]|uniref:uncharacterized protein LOC128210546 n=1 Tax=Mya arenaria TaxID=6604 RepID=UPI0022E70FE1|nr:uncharacterized protein LOC128210546 [Mya arenaria]